MHVLGAAGLGQPYRDSGPGFIQRQYRPPRPSRFFQFRVQAPLVVHNMHAYIHHKDSFLCYLNCSMGQGFDGRIQQLERGRGHRLPHILHSTLVRHSEHGGQAVIMTTMTSADRRILVGWGWNHEIIFNPAVDFNGYDQFSLGSVIASYGPQEQADQST